MSKESIVIPPAKPIDNPQLENLSSQTIKIENGTAKFGENKKYFINGIKIDLWSRPGPKSRVFST